MLPTLGLGLSTNLGPRDVPDPFRLHDRRPELFDFVEYSAPLALAEARSPRFDELRRRRATLPALFHPVHLNLYGPELESAEALAALAEHAREVGSPWVGNDVAWWHQAGAAFPGHLYLPPPFDEAGLSDCAAHAAHVQAALGVPLALENPTVVERTGPLHVLDFMAQLHARTGCPLILDVGHLWAFQLSAGLAATAGCDGFPFDQVIEIHVAGGVVTERGARRFYADDHAQALREEVFELLGELLPRCRGLRALTFEGDGQSEAAAVATLERLRWLVPSPSPSHHVLSGTQEARKVHVDPQVAARTFLVSCIPKKQLDASRPWDIYDRLIAHAGASLDPVGTAADRAYRLAVLAALLDRSWPLSRLLLAPDRDRLALFSASPEHRALYEGRGHDLDQAFATWGRRVLRETPDEGAERALAFESWARALTASAPGQPRSGTFPVDLAELCFAARALRRHLGGRAAACGTFESSALSALSPIAARAPLRPWRVAVSWSPGGLEVEAIGS